MVPFPHLTQQGRESYGRSSTERPRGTSAAKIALCARQATATVRQACAGTGGGHAERWGDLGGAKRRRAAGLLLSAATGGAVAVAVAGAVGPGRHRRPEAAKRPCGGWIGRSCSAASSQGRYRRGFVAAPDDCRN